MRIVITLDESLTVGAHIEEVPDPNPAQCLALRDLAMLAGQRRYDILDSDDGRSDGPAPREPDPH